MKTLTVKQLDAKFAKAAKLSAELKNVIGDIYLGCNSFEYGFGNSTALMNKVRWCADVLTHEREMHKANK